MILFPLTAQIDLGGVWRTLFYLASLLSLCLFLRPYLKALGFLPVLLWGYILAYCIYLVEYPAMPFGLVNRAYEATAGSVFIEVILLTVFCLHYPKQILKVLPYAVFLELYLCCFHNFYNWGFVGATSFDQAFLALSLPFVGWYLRIPIIFWVLTRHGATAQLILLAEFLGYGLHSKKIRPYALLAAVALVSVAYFHHFDTAGRIYRWKIMLKIWEKDWKAVIFGVGPGSFMWQSLVNTKQGDELFLQMHSDWLQVLFELGVIGFWLSLGVFGRALLGAWRKPQLFAGVLGVGVFALTYHPFRNLPPALLCGAILSLSLRSKK